MNPLRRKPALATATATPTIPALTRPATDPWRKRALIAGVLYLLTFVSIPTLALHGPVRAAGYIVGAGPDTGVVGGGMLELIGALAGIGTAIALYPVVRKQNESLALGLVGSRVVEAAMIFAGVAALLTIVTLRQDGAGAAALVTGDALVALYDRTFLLGRSTMPIVNAVLLGSLLYRSRLVPRALPMLGLIGAPLLLAANVGILFDPWERTSAIPAITVLPIAIGECSLGVYLVVKGFRQSALERLTA